MSNEVILERKKPHFISTEFKAQRLVAEQHLHEENLQRTTNVLKALSVIAMASVAYLFFNKEIKKSKKNKAALAYEVW